MVKRLRDKVNRADKASRANKANKTIRCDGRSNIERFFQPIYNHQ